jgi:hypothetical protein
MQKIPSTKSELAKYLLSTLTNDTNINIIKIYKGKSAVDKTKLLFFGEDKIEANEWSKQWSSYDKSQSMLVVYAYKSKTIHFKFIIGDKKTGSALGEKYKYEEGLDLLKVIKN